MNVRYGSSAVNTNTGRIIDVSLHNSKEYAIEEVEFMNRRLEATKIPGLAYIVVEVREVSA